MVLTASLYGKPSIQVKQSEGVGRPIVDNFVGVLDRQKDKKGIIIAFDFTRGAEAEVARLKREANIEIELIPCKRILREEIPYRQLANLSHYAARPNSGYGLA